MDHTEDCIRKPLGRGVGGGENCNSITDAIKEL